MGWGARLAAVVAMLILLAVGAWPVALIPLLYLVFSVLRARPRVNPRREGPRTGRPLGRYALGVTLLLLAVAAAEYGGRFSPYVFALGGVAAICWPVLRLIKPSGSVVPVRESVLLRGRFLPFVWHALVEVKLESADQTRGISAMCGDVLLYAGKSPSVFLLVSTKALGYQGAEKNIMRSLNSESKVLSQRGAHLLPLDSVAAARRLSMGLRRLDIGTEDFAMVSSLPFDAAAFRVVEGRVASHRAFRVVESSGSPSIPSPDLKHPRRPLFAEVVQEVGERHGWPGPDEFSAFLGELDAGRGDSLGDRLRLNKGKEDRLAVETNGGAQLEVARSQLRALAAIYGA
jgi:hypothetical protein